MSGSGTYTECRTRTCTSWRNPSAALADSVQPTVLCGCLQSARLVSGYPPIPAGKQTKTDIDVVGQFSYTVTNGKAHSIHHSRKPPPPFLTILLHINDVILLIITT
jgi:hypothetical protein